MKKLPVLACLVFVTTFFTACKPKPSGGVLEGSHWTLASAKMGSKAVAPLQGATFGLSFVQGRLSGSGPCNTYFASFSTDGANLEVAEMGVTERMCDEIDQENAYLGLLSKAEAYSVLPNRLEIFAGNGLLVFAPMPEEAIRKIEYENSTGKLEALFPVMEGDAMPHLYPILRVDDPGSYPFKGTLVDTSFYQYFDDETASIWRNSGGDVFAIGQYGGMFVARIPGRYVSSDIALFRNINNKMTRVETVAWAWCDEGWCNQQDAWLQDVDKNGRMDIVQHYTLTDDKGKIREERMTVLEQTEDGSFKENKSLKPDKSKFEMAKI